VAASAVLDDYPVRFDIDYPEGPRNRLTVFFRLLVAIPIFVVLAFLAGGGSAADMGEEDRDVTGSAQQVEVDRDWDGGGVAAATGGTVILPTVLMLLFRRKYPKWWFDWNVELNRFGARVGSFLGLMRDEYPSTDEEQAVHMQVDYPDATRLNRWLPLVKWLLAIPHYIVLFFLIIGAVFATIFAWFSILIVGRYPRGLFDFVVGVSRWAYRVQGYAFLLVTDRYPPFSTR
jgi:hypothetical protein